MRRNFEYWDGLFVCFVILYQFCVPRVVGAGSLELERKTIEGHKVFVVENRFYKLTIRPDAGACISSLQYGRGGKTELTGWDRGNLRGLFQESHTADFAYEVSTGNATPDEVFLEFKRQAGPLTIRKRYRFRREVPVFELSLVFENSSSHILGGPDAPGLSATILPGEGQQMRSGYFCFEGAHGPGAVTAASVLRELHPLSPVAGPLYWLSVTDTVTRRGLGFVFLDGAGQKAWAESNASGTIQLRWAYQKIPPRTRLTSKLLVVPLQRFSAVSGLDRNFAADTIAENREGKKRVTLRLMAVSTPLKDVSVVTRTYGKEGTELDPCDTLLFERLEPYHPVTKSVWVRAGEKKPVWLQHEVYVEGKKTGEFFVQTGQDGSPPRGRKMQLPLAKEQKIDPPAAPVKKISEIANEDDNKRGFLVRRLGTREYSGSDIPVEIPLFRREKETVFFRISALQDLETFRASLASSTGESARSLHPASAFLWKVEIPVSGVARLIPWEKQPLKTGAELWFALTVDASRLEPGSYSGKVFLEAAEKALQIPLAVRVFPVTISRKDGFAFWYMDGSDQETVPRQSVFERLSDYSVGAASWRVNAVSAAQNLDGILQKSERSGLDLSGIFCPGGSLATAEKVGVRGPIPGGMLAAGQPSWILWLGPNLSGKIDSLKGIGFRPAICLRRFQRLGNDFVREQSTPMHWLVGGGAQKERVDELIEDGKLHKEDSLWTFCDPREQSWERAALELRRRFVGAVWEGMAGAVVVQNRPVVGMETQELLWHVLRDAREEAAVFATARDAKVRLLAGSSESRTENTSRAEVFGGLERLFGGDNSSRIRVQRKKIPFGQISLGTINGSERTNSIAAFRKLKGEALRLLIKARALPEKVLNHNTVYWKSRIVLAEGEGKCAFWNVNGQEIPEGLRALKLHLEKLVGASLPVIERYPLLERSELNVLWIDKKEASGEEFPEEVRKLASATPDGSCRSWVDKTGLKIVIVGPEAAPENLIHVLSTRPLVYRRISAPETP